MLAAYAPYKERMQGQHLPPLEVDYAREIAEYPCWVVENEGKIAGGLIMVFEAEVASIANIAVHPNYQGQGLGGQLMAFAEGEARRRGYNEMVLATHVLLTENVRFYEKLGWSVYARDEVRVQMRKVLSQLNDGQAQTRKSR